jgi:hypothetical protein
MMRGQSKVSVVDLQRQPDETEDLAATQANFRERSTFDFFNRVGPKSTFTAAQRHVRVKRK